MLFNSWQFIAFYALVLAVYCITTHRWQNRLLLLSSYFFYAQWDWRFLALIWLSTIVDFFVALGLDRFADPRQRKRLLAVSVCTNLGILGCFKYADFFIGSAQDLLQRLGMQSDVPSLQLILPVGISFYTFQTLGYTIDVYRRRLSAERNPETFALYVAYFPQLVAGPIERAQRLLPQFRRPRVLTGDAWRSGAQLILIGFFKKVFIADTLAGYVNEAFENPEAMNSPALLLATYGFTLQIYCDFSGYSDIARGTSRLFGIELMENFRQPYFARNVSEFWRRWHISLSTWLRDYLYIPLGGNRRGPMRQRLNLMTTMLLGGLWHGASWTFIAWGALHGTYLVLHSFIRSDGEKRSNPMVTLLYILATFHCVSLTWIPFRASTIESAITYCTLLMTNWESSLSTLTSVPIALPLAVSAVLIALLDIPCWRSGRELPFTTRHPWWLRGFSYGIMLILLAFAREGIHEPFIYFQF